jgi:hypothetical protein
MPLPLPCRSRRCGTRCRQTAAIDRPVPARLTLQEALARAIETSHILAELRARESVGRGRPRPAQDRRPAGALAQAGYRRTNHVEEFGVPQPNPPRIEIIYPDVPDNWRTRLDLRGPSTAAAVPAPSSVPRTPSGRRPERISRALAPTSSWKPRAPSGRW